MNRHEKRCVLDASALLEWALERPRHSLIAQILPHSVLPVSCLTESIYITHDHRLHRKLKNLGVDFEKVTYEDAIRAGQLIDLTRRDQGTTSSLSLGDGLCIAVAERLDLPLVSSDQLWEALDLVVPVHSFK